MIMKKLMIWAIVAMGTALMCAACLGVQKPQREAKVDTTTVSREIITNEDKQPVSTALDVKSFGFMPRCRTMPTTSAAIRLARPVA